MNFDVHETDLKLARPARQPRSAAAVRAVHIIDKIEIAPLGAREVVHLYAIYIDIRRGRLPQIPVGDAVVVRRRRGNRRKVVNRFYLVPMTIPAFKEHCPEVGIQLYEEIAYSDIEKDLLEGRAFLGIGNWQSKDPRLSAEVLREEELLLAVDENHVVAKSLGVKPGDPPMAVDYQNFKDDPVIVPKGTTTAGLQQEFSRAYNPSQPIFLETRNIENALRLAAEGFGLTFLCDTHINFQYLPKNLVFFSVGIPKMTLYLLRRANSYTPSYVHTYIEILRQYY